MIEWPREGGMPFLGTYSKTRAGLGTAEAWIPDGKMLGKHTLISQKTCGVETITLAKPNHGNFLDPRVKCSFLLFTKGGPESVAVLTFLEVGMEAMGWERNMCNGFFLLGIQL